MKTQTKVLRKAVKKLNVEIKAEGELVVKVDSAIASFGINHDGTTFVFPLSSGKYKFIITDSPLNSSLKVYFLFELKPEVFVNLRVLQSHVASTCEVVFFQQENMALPK